MHSFLPKGCFLILSQTEIQNCLDDSNWLGSPEATGGIIDGEAAKAVLSYDNS
jgi:hypothetical protein